MCSVYVGMLINNSSFILPFPFPFLLITIDNWIVSNHRNLLTDELLSQWNGFPAIVKSESCTWFYVFIYFYFFSCFNPFWPFLFISAGNLWILLFPIPLFPIPFLLSCRLLSAALVFSKVDILQHRLFQQSRITSLLRYSWVPRGLQSEAVRSDLLWSSSHAT